MFNKLQLAILLCGLMVTIVAHDQSTTLAQRQQSLKAIEHIQNQRLVDIQPSAADECQVWLQKTQNECVSTYFNNTLQCGYTSSDAKKKLSVEGAPARADLEKRTNKVFADLNSCVGLKDLKDFYDCYRNASSNGYKQLYNISTESDAEHASLSVKYDNIDADEVACYKICDQLYYAALADIQRDYQSCRDGNGVPKKPMTQLASEPEPEPEQESQPDSQLSANARFNRMKSLKPAGF